MTGCNPRMSPLVAVYLTTIPDSAYLTTSCDISRFPIATVGWMPILVVTAGKGPVDQTSWRDFMYTATIHVWQNNGNGIRPIVVGTFATKAEARRAAREELARYAPDDRGEVTIGVS